MFIIFIEPGEVIFQSGTAHMQQIDGVAMVTATVVRIRGSNGSISVYYRTMYECLIFPYEIHADVFTFLVEFCR